VSRFAVSGAWGDAQNGCRLVDGQPDEVAEFREFCRGQKMGATLPARGFLDIDQPS
jgi:hypothetical protein